MTDRPRILVIDDDAACARMLEIAFRTTRAEVVTQGRAFGALTAIASLRPVLVIVDVMMPGLDGPSICELLRSDEELASTRVVLWSALTKHDLDARGKECGADAVYEKVSSPLGFVQQVVSWLAQWDGIDIT